MNLQAERLSSLIEFCYQSARLRGRPTSTIEAHRNFSLYESDLHDIPGVTFNLSDEDGTDELWLSVDRLHETKPPEVKNKWLSPWILVARGPYELPTLKTAVEGASLIAAGIHQPEKSDKNGPKINHEDSISLETFEEAARVQALFDEYVKAKWTPWAAEEKKRLKTIKLYVQLFTLKQQLEGGIVEAQLELVWGVGIGVQKTAATTVKYPLISKLVDLSLNPVTAALEVRPRDVEPRIELDWYAAQDNQGVADLEKLAKKFFKEIPTTFSPFDRATFEPLLQASVINLDAHGVYWPTQAQPNDRLIPKAEDKLKVTDTWVLLARPRTNSSYLQDLERLRADLEGLEELPPAVAAILTDPDTEKTEIDLPLFRGGSASDHTNSRGNSSKPKKLYFPKPFNDEQARIIQLLDIYDGVVVQGPPGTGKTHTIANVICHFLANGKRVLVTSMKDPALGVIQEKLPDEIHPLSISLLTSEQDGLKKFEHSIQKIASEIQIIDRAETLREIQHLEERIDALHGQLVRIDRDISTWAKKNLSKIRIDEEEQEPKDAAQELVNNSGQYEWIPDDINITKTYEPKFSDTDIKELRDARRELGAYSTYLNTSLPKLLEFPDLKSILKTHQDLSKLNHLLKEGEVEDVLSLGTHRIQ